MFASGVSDDEGTVLLADEPRSDVWLLLGDDPQVDDWWVPDAMTPAVPLSPVGTLPPAGPADALLAGQAGALPLAGRAGSLPVAGPADAHAAGRSRGDEQLGGEDSAAAVPAGGPSSALDRWSAASLLERLEPGSGLAAVLELLDPELLNPPGPDDGPLDDVALVEAVAAWERLAAWAHLGAALTAGVLSRRESMNPHWQSPVPSRTCVAGDELAMRLGWSRPAAHRLVRDGRALQGGLMPVADAVREGLVDTPKLRVLTDRLHDRPYQLSWPVQEAVLPKAALRTPTQLAADIDRALLAVDPEDAALRLPRAIASRHVCHPRRLPDGMAGLWAVLPAADAARVDATLEATARTARAVGDPARWTSCAPTPSPTSPPGRPSSPGRPSPSAAATRVVRRSRTGPPTTTRKPTRRPTSGPIPRPTWRTTRGLTGSPTRAPTRSRREDRSGSGLSESVFRASASTSPWRCPL